jgi:GNAT superfamily N-acetyltransferase
MYWRLGRAAFEAQKGAPNREAFRRLVEAGPPPGILAYDGTTPVGWCAVAPRIDLPRLQRSRMVKGLDVAGVWSLPCLFVARGWRGRGASVELVRSAARWAREQGAAIVEGYPVVPRTGRLPDAFAWTGLPTSFSGAGFEEVARPSPTRPIYRKLSR